MRTADEIVWKNWESDRRLNGLRRELDARINYMVYALYFDLPRVNSDAEVWESC